jgi:hypothetical protein
VDQLMQDGIYSDRGVAESEIFKWMGMKWWCVEIVDWKIKPSKEWKESYAKEMNNKLAQKESERNGMHVWIQTRINRVYEIYEWEKQKLWEWELVPLSNILPEMVKKWYCITLSQANVFLHRLSREITNSPKLQQKYSIIFEMAREKPLLFKMGD